MMHLHAGLTIGDKHLSVADIDRSIAFYCDLIGLRVIRTAENQTTLQPGAHHKIVLEPPHRLAPLEAPVGFTGFYHFSFLYPERRDLARILEKLMDVAYPVEQAIDYGIVEAVYLRDPDGIPIELYTNCPKHLWERSETGEVIIVPRPLTVDQLFRNLR